MNPIYKFNLSSGETSRNLTKRDFSAMVGRIDFDEKFYSDDEQRCGIIEITDGTDSLKIVASSNGGYFAFLTDNNLRNGEFAPLVADTILFPLTDGETVTTQIPAGTKYLYVYFAGYWNDTFYNMFPSEIVLYGTNIQRRVFPIYNDNLAKDFEKESGQEFFRAKLSGELTFESDDYNNIVSRPFDTEFVLEIFISYDAGVTWASYWAGTFWKTDCKFDDDAETVVVKPTVLDQYNDVLAGLDKEYNLIDLAPQIIPVKADKRPMVQVYVPNQSVIGCFLSGMWWEQECEPVSDEERVEIPGGGTMRKLEYVYKFALNKGYTNIRISGEMTPQLPANVSNVVSQQSAKYFDFSFGGFSFYRRTGTTFDLIGIYDPNTGANWHNERVSRDLSGNYTVKVFPVEGTAATGTVTLDIETINVFARYLCDVDEIGDTPTYQIPDDDMVENNRNYTRVIGYQFPDTITFSNKHTETPTKWGLYQPNEYYEQPYSIYGQEFIPVARNGWGYVSVWFSPFVFDYILEQSARKAFTIRYAYPIFSVISVLLGKIAPNITHDGTNDYSQFLYGGTNLIGVNQVLLITPKSNIVSAGYDQPAMSAPITLRNVLDMLRDCFRCYWFIDETGKFRVEHILYFRNGGSYSGSPVVGIDLTAQKVSRNGKSWDFARNQYQYDKPQMAARYQFNWADDVTELFDGFPIEIISKFVNPENIEQVNVARFTSDLDYILLNPSAVSKDGFVLLASKNVSWAEQLVQPLQYSWNGGAIQTAIDLTSYRGQTMRISVSTTRAYLSVSQTGNDTSEMIGQISNEPNTTKTFEFEVADDAEYIILYGPQVGVATISSLALRNGQYELPYVNYVVDGNNHYLQNAWVAFCILQEYYAYDMPAPAYEINGVTKTAIGVKRLKTQSVQFPLLNDPNLLQLIKTSLGNGTIEKISLNLSSRNANATLKYDTE